MPGPDRGDRGTGWRPVAVRGRRLLPGAGGIRDPQMLARGT